MIENISKTRIIQLINKSLKEVSVTENMENIDLGAIGLDSLTFVQLIVNIEDEFNCKIPDSKLILSQMNTVNKIFDILSNL